MNKNVKKKIMKCIACDMETNEGYEKMREMIMAYDYKIFCEEHRKELDTLINRLGCILSDKFRVAPVGQAVAIKDKDIVSRLFPNGQEQ